jgi:hypothetical protein
MAVDFKSEHQPDPAEHAKDMAAFANAFGGGVLVGVAEKADSFARKLVDIEVARKIALDYENAARDLLAPRPLVDPCIVRHPDNDDRALVAVNIEPFAGQLVGAKLPQTQGWRFPIRTAARHCTYLDPEKLMMYSDARTRKAAILLTSIAEFDRSQVFVRVVERRQISNHHASSEVVLGGRLCSVDPEHNAVHLVVDVHVWDRNNEVAIFAPLEDIDAVWKGGGKWYIRLDGAIQIHASASGPKSIWYMSGRS